VRARYGVGATGERVVVLDRALVRLRSLDPRGVLAHLRLEEGDLLGRLDGEPLAPDALDRLATAVATEGSGAHALEVLRRGVAFTAVYAARR
jgi:hypothetical protein